MRWKRVALLAAVGADDHAHRERRAVLARAQRAEIVGDALRQHRHDPVGEIDRVAALQRLAVERRAGPHIGRDVGDRDRDDEAARVVGIVVRRGMDGVVVVLGVGRIDGDERQRAPVLAALRAPTGCAASASASTSGGNTCGMPCAWMAMRLTAFSELSEPSRSRTCACGQAVAAGASRSPAATRSPSCAPPSSPGGIRSSTPRAFLSTGTSRPPPSGRARKMPSTCAFCLPMILMTRPA